MYVYDPKARPQAGKNIRIGINQPIKQSIDPSIRQSIKESDHKRAIGLSYGICMTSLMASIWPLLWHAFSIWQQGSGIPHLAQEQSSRAVSRVILDESGLA